MVKKYQRFFNVLQISLDALTLMFAFVAAMMVDKQVDVLAQNSRSELIAAIWMVPLLISSYYFMDVYTPMRSRMFRKEARMVARAHFVGIFMTMSVLFIHQQAHLSREAAIYFAGLGLLFLLVERYMVRHMMRYVRRKGYNQKHVLIIGAGVMGREYARKLRNHRNFGYNVIGFLDDKVEQNQTVVGVRVLGSCDTLEKVLENRSIEEVVVALPLNAYPRHGNLVTACEKAGVRIRIIPDYGHYLPTGTPQIEEFDGIHLLNVRKLPLDDPLLRFLKRAFDITVASSALVVASPVMLMIAIGIKVTSPGPLLFRQKRVGLNNHTFDMLKFRSMRVDIDQTASTTWTTANDPRKTKFGAFLRKTSLDELPQFFNVLANDMSVIGPRPERPFFVDQFKEEIPQYMVKHQVKPGITGWAQVNGWRGDTSIRKRIECDIYYIENWELLLDIKIMFLTFLKGLVNKNAY